MATLLEQLVHALAADLLAQQGGEATEKQIDCIANHEVTKLQQVAAHFPYGQRVLVRIAEMLLLAPGVSAK